MVTDPLAERCNHDLVGACCVRIERTKLLNGRKQVLLEHAGLLTCTLLVTCAVEHVGYVVGGHGLGLELSAGQSDGDVLQGA